MKRLHLHVSVDDLAKSIDFYSTRGHGLWRRFDR
jgi:hypothetical protein